MSVTITVLKEKHLAQSLASDSCNYHVEEGLSSSRPLYQVGINIGHSSPYYLAWFKHFLGLLQFSFQHVHASLDLSASCGLSVNSGACTNPGSAISAWKPTPFTSQLSYLPSETGHCLPIGQSSEQSCLSHSQLQRLPLSRFSRCLRAYAQSVVGISALPFASVGSEINLRQLICQQPALYFELFFQCGYELIPPHPCSHIQTRL